MTDAFGIVALVAMTPLITIQILGVIYKWKLKETAEEEHEEMMEPEIAMARTEPVITADTLVHATDELLEDLKKDNYYINLEF